MPTGDRFEALPQEDIRTLERLIRVVEAIRTVEPNMPIGWLNAFLAVAKSPGEGPTHYARECGTIQPIMSRVLLELGPKARTGGPGLLLLDRVYGDTDYRSQRYYLTPKGKQLLKTILKSLGGNS